MEKKPDLPSATPHTSGKRTWIFVLLGGLLLLGAGGRLFWHQTKGEKKDLAVQAEWQSSDSPSLTVAGVLQVSYRDLGDQVELSIVTNANPVIFVDVNANHQPNAGDVSYAAGPENSVCVKKLGTSTSVDCNSPLTHATVWVTRKTTSQSTTWRLPKREIATDHLYADIQIETFHERTQTGEFYPDAPLFSSVFRLKFSEDSSSAVIRSVGGLSTQTYPRQGEAPSSSSASSKGPGEPIPNADAPDVREFSVTPVSNNPLSGFRLHWKVGHATSVSITPEIGDVLVEGDKVVIPQATTKYTLTAIGSLGKRTTRELTIAMGSVAPPKLVSFSAESDSVPAGGTTHLSWQVDGDVTSVKIDPIGDSFPTTGSRTILVARTTEYSLTAEGPGGNATGKLTVRTYSPELPTISFDGSQGSITPESAVTLRWTVTGADAISIEPGVGRVAATGSSSVRPQTSTRYILSAENAAGIATREFNVTVGRPSGAHGRIIWAGEVHGTQLISIDHDHADIGRVDGELPGQACVLQIESAKDVSIASAPGPRNNFEHLVLRAKGNGSMRIVIDWVAQ